MTTSFPNMHNIGKYVTVVPSLANAAGTGSAQAGASVDRTGYLSGFAVVNYSTSGGVTGGSIAAKLQDSADGSTWTDYGSAVSVTLSGTNPSGVIQVNADLGPAKKYVRAVVTASPTGGTPASSVGAAIVLGGKDRL